MFVAGLLLGLDASAALIIWAIWLAGSLLGYQGPMTIDDVPVPVAVVVPLGPLALASLVAVWLISGLRGYAVVLGIALAGAAFAVLAYASGAVALGTLAVTRLVVVALLVSGRPAFRTSSG